MKITVSKRKIRPFSMATLRTDLNTLQLIFRRAIDDAQKDISRHAPAAQRMIQDEINEMKSLLEQMEDEDLFCDGLRTRQLVSSHKSAIGNRQS